MSNIMSMDEIRSIHLRKPDKSSLCQCSEHSTAYSSESKFTLRSLIFKALNKLRSTYLQNYLPFSTNIIISLTQPLTKPCTVQTNGKENSASKNSAVKCNLPPNLAIYTEEVFVGFFLEVEQVGPLHSFINF